MANELECTGINCNLKGLNTKKSNFSFYHRIHFCVKNAAAFRLCTFTRVLETRLSINFVDFLRYRYHNPLSTYFLVSLR